MSAKICNYLIIGGGLAGGSAVQGIRDYDKTGTIILLGEEKYLPYDRPYLTKDLWSGKKKLDEIYLQGREFYDGNKVELELGSRVASIDPEAKSVTAENGSVYRYDKLLLATGGVPRRLLIPGTDLEGICYYRYLDDYLKTRAEVGQGRSAVVIGGGFIGSEIAAGLTMNGVKVTMIFPSPYLVDRIFPKDLGSALTQYYIGKGVDILAGDRPKRFSKKEGLFITETEKGKHITSEILLVGIGIAPSVELAQQAKLRTENGIVVEEYLETSHKDIYAAGDNALFPYQGLGRMMRVEHWDNAVTQGKWAGWNMAGAHKPYTYMPYFFSDLFEFGYEAVGDIDSRLESFEDWEKQNEKGVIYYLKDSRIRGVMMCNVWEKVEAARELIRKGKEVTPSRLKDAIYKAA